MREPPAVLRSIDSSNGYESPLGASLMPGEPEVRDPWGGQAAVGACEGQLVLVPGPHGPVGYHCLGLLPATLGPCMPLL